jgi:hypothetical protein
MNPSNISVNPDLLAYIDPLTPEEHSALERSLLAEGCRDALVLWGDVLVDGHNRHGICVQHGIAFSTVQNVTFKSMDDVHLWMIDQHLGRRSVSDFQRGVLALRKKDILAARVKPVAVPAPEAGPPSHAQIKQEIAAMVAPLTREATARAARVSSATIAQIQKIQASATPELLAAVKSGAISINTAATVASLPAGAQLAAAAGGKKELQLAARQVRESKVSPRQPASPESPESPDSVIARLKFTITELTAENAVLKSRLAELGAV